MNFFMPQKRRDDHAFLRLDNADQQSPIRF